MTLAAVLARRTTAGLLAVVVGLGAGRVDANCNAIPGAPSSFRGTVGVVDRPFASPGDLVTLTGLAAARPDLVVTVVFTPPDGPRNAVVLTSAPTCDALDAARTRCGDALGTPPPCVTADDAAIAVEGTTLTFRFPDTDALVGAADDGLPLTGPAAIVVTTPGAPLPCEQPAESVCRDTPDVAACLDVLFHPDATAGALPGETFPNFTALPPPNDVRRLCIGSALCAPTPTRALHFTVDAAGNALVPMDWHGVLHHGETCLSVVPTVARLIESHVSVPAFAGDARPLAIPSNAFLRSFTPEGIPVAPIFDPQLADSGAPGGSTIFGSADGCRSVLRIARRGRGLHACADAIGGQTGVPCNDPRRCPLDACADECGPGGTCAPSTCGGLPSGTACTSDAECPGSECGPALFELRDRLVERKGPVSIDATFAIAELVPLEGLIETPDLFAFVVPEALNRDLNGDADDRDEVLVLVDRRSGQRQELGSPGVGPAVVRVQEPPFSYPAVAADGDMVAFLESEPGAADDVNTDGDVIDGVLRVFRLGDAEVSLGSVSVDAAPRIDDRSLAISRGNVFFRAGREDPTTINVTAGVLMRQPEAPSGGEGGGQAISADGQVQAFWSEADDFELFALPNDADRNGVADVFVRPLIDLCGTRRQQHMELVSITPAGIAGNGESVTPALSADGRFVAFLSEASDLVAGDGNGIADVVVRDRCPATCGGACVPSTERVSVADDGAEADGASLPFVAISGDGRFVAFASAATNLVAGDGNAAVDVFVRDRCRADGEPVDGCTPGTERVSVRSDGAEGHGDALPVVSLSADGRVVAFASRAADLVSGDTKGDTNGAPDVFVHDRLIGTTTRVSVATGGAESAGGGAFPALSGDGRTVAFASAAADLVGDDTNGAVDVFVHDRVNGTTERASAGADGRQSNGDSFAAALSYDGRHLAFASDADMLVPDDANGVTDVFVRDQLTGIVTRASVSNKGQEGNQASTGPTTLSADGSQLLFASAADNLEFGAIFPDLDGVRDVFVHEMTTADAVLHVVKTGDRPLERRALCPATDVAVADGAAVFLVPETAKGGHDRDCPTTKAGLENGDADRDDLVVHAWSTTERVQNLRCAARAVATSGEWMAALVDEAAEFDADRNGDGDRADAVVAVRRLRDPAPASCARWRNLDLAADAVAVRGAIVAFTTPEAAQGMPGEQDANGDGDAGDRVLHIYDSELPEERSLDLGAVEEFVLGGTPGRELVAFRDADDQTLRVYDVAAHCTIETGLEVVPCDQVACDPRRPFKVGRDTVTFVARDAAGHPLVHVLNVRYASAHTRACATAIARTGGASAPRVAALSSDVAAGAVLALGAAARGVCTGSGAACTSDATCTAGETCFVPPGACVEDLAIACTPPPVPSPGPLPEDAASVTAADDTCSSPSFCVPLFGEPSRGTCRSVVHEDGRALACTIDADCRGTARCAPLRREAQRVPSPVTRLTAGAQAHLGAGQCVDASGRVQGSCRDDGDCRGGTSCVPSLVTFTVADSDGDEIPDPFDNCPEHPNVLQENGDDLAPGDACQAVTCPPVPRTDCAAPFDDGGRLRVTAGRTTDHLVWRWRGPARGGFGDPTRTDGYGLCVYDGSSTDAPRLSLAAPAGGACRRGGSCWRAKGRGGFGYRAPQQPVGITEIQLRASARDERLLVRARIDAQTGIEAGTSPVVVQVVNGRTGTCWGTPD